MGLSESMKSLLAKQQQQQQSSGGNPMNLHMPAGTSNPSPSPSSGNLQTPGVGYVTEKLYMLLQLYLQNKGWNPSTELLQCFAELKDSPLLPNAAYLQCENPSTTARPTPLTHPSLLAGYWRVASRWTARAGSCCARTGKSCCRSSTLRTR